MANPRAIFEEVNETKRDAALTKTRPTGTGRAVRIWLWLLFALVTIMILVGGLTRLTDSGLSITEWNLVFGTLPPLDADTWASEFNKYQQTQEFMQINSTMTLAEFKGIYWWEWGHRLLGRFIGLFWALGFLTFALRGQIRRDRVRSVFWVGILIGLQGVIGILMVKSGYIGARVDVASYALATHLGMAFVILGLIYWNIKTLSVTQALLVEARRNGNRKMTARMRVLVALVFVQVLLGALVAGIDAGRSYTDWPLMGGQFFSNDSFILTPWWKNFFESPALVQFMHRMNAYLIFLVAVWFWLANRHAAYDRQQRSARTFLLAVVLQVVMGIVTLIHGAPLYEALAHQFLAIGVWIHALSTYRAFRYPAQQVITA